MAGLCSTDAYRSAISAELSTSLLKVPMTPLQALGERLGLVTVTGQRIIALEPERAAEIAARNLKRELQQLASAPASASLPSRPDDSPP